MAHLHLVSAPARYQADEAMIGDNISIDIPGLPDDPDSGLTVAEKAALVSTLKSPISQPSH